MLEAYAVPKPDENTSELTMGDWLLSEGDSFTTGDPLCEMIAGKGAFEYLALNDGILVRRLLSPGSVIPVGYLFALISTTDVSTVNVELITEMADKVERENKALLESFRSGLASGSNQTESVRATPAARRLAKEKQVDLAVVKAALGIEGAIKPEHIIDFLSR